MVVGVPGVAYGVTGDPLPRPVREIAHNIGLPVQSPDLADAERVRSQLRDALAESDYDGLIREADDLERRLQTLEGPEREKLAKKAEQLLLQADEIRAAHDAAD
jgi:hypothetical protein